MITPIKITLRDLDNSETLSKGLASGVRIERTNTNRAISVNPNKKRTRILMYVATLCCLLESTEDAICPPSNCQAGIKFRNVIRNPIVAAKVSGDNINTDPSG